MRPLKNMEIADGVNFVPEEIFPTQSNRIPLRNIVLGSIAIAGIISVALIAPNAVQLLKFVRIKHKPKYDFRYRVPETIRKLQAQGLITISTRNSVAYAALTKNGRKILLREKIRIRAIPKPKIWDGKWRMVIFDVQETRKVLRDRFREELQRFGFVKVQNSVWVFPYDCADLIFLLKMERQIGKEVLYVIAEHIEGDSFLRQQFNLRAGSKK